MKKKVNLKLEQKKFEEYANKKLKSLQKKLLLEHHFLKPIRYDPTIEATANYTLDYPYRDIRIKYGDGMRDAWVNGDRASVDQYLTHEICHVLTDGLMKKALERNTSEEEIRDQLEQTNEHLTKLVLTYVK